MTSNVLFFFAKLILFHFFFQCLAKKKSNFFSWYFSISWYIEKKRTVIIKIKFGYIVHKKSSIINVFFFQIVKFSITQYFCLLHYSLTMYADNFQLIFIFLVVSLYQILIVILLLIVIINLSFLNFKCHFWGYVQFCQNNNISKWHNIAAIMPSI